MPWGFAIGAAGVIGGALISSSGSRGAASTQAQAAAQAQQTQLQMQQNAINQVAPWRNAGMGALNQYSMLMGLGSPNMGSPSGGVGGSPSGVPPSNASGPIPTQPGVAPGQNQFVTGQSGPTGGGQVATGGRVPAIPGDASGGAPGAPGMDPNNPAANISSWMTQLPGYQFQLGQGTSAVENSAAARGMGLSSNTLQNLDQFGQGLAGTTFNQWLDRLNNMSTVGANASTGNASNIMQSASNIGGYQIGAGNALAAGQVGSANAINAGLGGVGNSFMDYSMMRNLMGGGGSGGGGDSGTGDVIPMGGLGSGTFDLFGSGGGP